MSFLDNLENNLKALEQAEEADPEKQKRLREARAAEKDAARRAAPHAEALKTSAFTEELLKSCRLVGHRLRTLVRATWIDSTLRLEAREKKLELSPYADGVRASFYVDGVEVRQHPIDLNGDAAALVEQWLTKD